MQVANGRHNLLVAAATGQVMVYGQNRLVWSAKGDITPVAIKVATIANLPGLVLSLDDAGQFASAVQCKSTLTSVFAHQCARMPA